MNNEKKQKAKHVYETVWPFSLDKANQYVFVDDAFTVEECQKIISIGKQISLLNAEIKGSNKNNRVRDSKVSWMTPSEQTSWVYKKITNIVYEVNSKIFNYDLFGILEAIQFTEYSSPGGKYAVHADCSDIYMPRKLSLSLQLTNPKEYEGGELKLHYGQDSIVCPKKQGTVILFPSYTLHEVTPTTKGTRHSLVTWITGPNFR